MDKILRKPETAARKTYDMIIVGGGIYGAMLSLEASLRGLRSLLLECNDFGSATSFNSLRIIHGGFRYLQNLNIQRFRESFKERKWFLSFFPELVKPLPCLMPLYGKGLRRPSILKAGLLINEILSSNRNRGLREDRKIPSGRVVDINQVKNIFPYVDMKDLKGGVVWYDAFLPDSQHLITEVLRLSCRYGATNLNYMEVCDLLTIDRNVAGVNAIDRVSEKPYVFKGKNIINASGPWCRELAKQFDRDESSLFKSSLVWNLLLNRKTISDHALAVAPKTPGGQTYFLVPWKGKLLAGTGHAPWLSNEKNPMPSSKQLQEFLDDLNIAIPSLDLNRDDILRIFPGLQPATIAGGTKLAEKEIIYDHSKKGGPKGLYSISGVKFTTARLVAQKTLERIYPSNTRNHLEPINTEKKRHIERSAVDIDFITNENNQIWKKTIKQLIDEESVVHLDDLIFRRTSLWEYPEKIMKILPLLCDLFNWDTDTCHAETERLGKMLVVEYQLNDK